ncbi:MAG TPA: ATP-binding protein [Acidimicrobiales bacterium]|nr:ATP-binding protein [Acidimicrobiales bacterium]
MSVGDVLEATWRPDAPALLTRVRARARRRALWLRHLWSHWRVEGDQWLAISHGEVDRILIGCEELAASELSFYATDPGCLELSAAVNASDRAVAADPAWAWLQQDLGLDPAEADLLALALAAEIDPFLRRAYGYLLDETGPADASPLLASALFQWAPEHDPRVPAALLRWALARPSDPGADPAARSTGWVADPLLVPWLAGRGDGLGTDEEGAVRRVAAGGQRDGHCLYPDLLDAMVAFVHAVGGPTLPAVELELAGRPGDGKRTLAGQLGDRLGRAVLAIDVARLLSGDLLGHQPIQQVVRVGRSARLSGAIPYWHGLGGVDAAVIDRLRGLAPIAVLGVVDPMPVAARPDVVRRAFRLPPLRRAMRLGLWRRLSHLPPPPVVDWDLTPAELAAAAAAAPAGPEAVAESCRRVLSLGPGELFNPLPCPYAWDELVLTPPVRRHLEEFEVQARLRRTVYEEWGFGRLTPLGGGVTALFAGPSGTGKTMAAQVVARSLGMNLYRVDLAGVVNKYIGETEKRLKRVFDACERSDVVLLFDEADALFGQRTQVREANDRFANIEIDYLLQRMEQFEGVAVLTTNRKSDIDKAFLRRLRFIVDFIAPGPEERRRLWHLALPDRAPDGTPLLEDIDWDLLATRLEMSGADIKAAALAAAFLARDEGARIGMGHVMHAARRELTKHSAELHHGSWEV